VRGAIGRFGSEGKSISRGSVQLAMIKVVLNSTPRRWAGFDTELQEKQGVPSSYGDGLSFDQVRRFKKSLRSDRFLSSQNIDEPYDRIRFTQGYVPPGQSVRFDFYIIDPTPIDEFYILQAGRIVIAKAPGDGVLLAAHP
jgi:hypothetical protein